jgi:hypothetical protein
VFLILFLPKNSSSNDLSSFLHTRQTVYLDLQKIDNQLYVRIQNELVQYLCSICGFYDKSLIGSYFDFDLTQVKESPIYNAYFYQLLETVRKNKDVSLELNFHTTDDQLLEWKNNF